MVRRSKACEKMTIERTLELGSVLVLAMTLPVAVIASRGFRGAPFGAVLRPLPVIVVAYIGLNVPNVLGVSPPPIFYVVTSTIGVVGAFVSAAHAIVLLTEWQKL